MTSASRLLAVAAEATPGVTAALLGGDLVAPDRTHTAATVSMTQREVARLKAPEAEAVVPYLDAETLNQVFVNDRRKGVRAQAAATGRLTGDALVTAIVWLASPDGPSVNSVAVVDLVSRCDDEQLDRLAEYGDRVQQWAISARARRVSTVDAARELFEASAHQPYRQRQLFWNLLASKHREVRAYAVEAIGAQLDEALKYADVHPGVVDALLEHPAVFNQLLASRNWNRYTSLDPRVVSALAKRLGGPATTTALAALEVTGRLGMLTDPVHHDALVRSAPSLTDQQLATLASELPAASATGEVLTALAQRLTALLGAQEATDTLSLAAERLFGHGLTTLGVANAEAIVAAAGTTQRVLDAAAAALATLDRTVEYQADTVGGSLAAAGSSTEGLRRLLDTAPLSALARFRLLPHTDGDLAARLGGLIDDLVAEGSALLDAHDADAVLYAGALPDGLRVRLVDACGAHAGDLRWLVDAEHGPGPDTALTVARGVSYPHLLPKAFLADHDEVVDVLIERCARPADTDEDTAGPDDSRAVMLAHQLLDSVQLDDERLARLVTNCPAAAGSALLRESRTNNIDHDRRQVILAHCEVHPAMLVASWLVAAPTDDELGLMTRELFAVADQGHDDLRTRPVARLVDDVPLPAEQLVAALVAAPDLLGDYCYRRTRANPFDAEVLCQVLAQRPSGVDKTVVLNNVELLVSDPDTRQWLATDHVTLDAVVKGRDSEALRTLLRFVWEYAHAELGDDHIAWEQFATRLDSWPGALADLCVVSKVASGSN